MTRFTAIVRAALGTTLFVATSQLAAAQQSIEDLEAQLGPSSTDLVRLRTTLEFLRPPQAATTTDPELK